MLRSWKRVAMPLVAMAVLMLGIVAISAHGSDNQPEINASQRNVKAPTCAASFSHAPRNHNERSRTSLVPSGAREVLLCRYRPLRGTIAKDKKPLLVSRNVSRIATVASLSDALDKLEVAPSGVHGCLGDNGARLYALFSFADQPDVPVSVSLSGCRVAWNGKSKTFSVSPGLLAQLSRLTSKSSSTDAQS